MTSIVGLMKTSPPGPFGRFGVPCDEQPPGKAHLRCRQADAVLRPHQFDHPASDGANLVIHVWHIMGPLPQRRGRVQKNAQGFWIDGHGCMVEEATGN